MKNLFTPLNLERITLPHRVLRAATFENMADSNGNATKKHAEHYLELARGGVGTIITGFNYTSMEGRAMQPFQAGIDSEEKVEAWARVIAAIKAECPETRMILQISHAGRQTIKKVTGLPVVGAGRIPCTYFLQPVTPLAEWQVDQKVEEYIEAAIRAEHAGFDGVEIHGAHGYLIHQFLSPYTNRRRDRWGQDRLLFLKNIIQGIKAETNFALFLKFSAADDQPRGLNLPLTLNYLREIDQLGLDAIEISYGMMEVAFNIIRGDHPIQTVLKNNMLFTRYPKWLQKLFLKTLYPFYYQPKFKPYSPLYNLQNAKEIRKVLKKTPMLVTGGVRSVEQIEYCLRHGMDGVTMSRPFLIEPEIMKRFKSEQAGLSRCIQCNLCTVMSDSQHAMRCYSRNKAFKNFCFEPQDCETSPCD